MCRYGDRPKNDNFVVFGTGLMVPILNLKRRINDGSSNINIKCKKRKMYPNIL